MVTNVHDAANFYPKIIYISLPNSNSITLTLYNDINAPFLSADDPDGPAEPSRGGADQRHPPAASGVAGAPPGMEFLNGIFTRGFWA